MAKVETVEGIGWERRGCDGRLSEVGVAARAPWQHMVGVQSAAAGATRITATLAVDASQQCVQRSPACRAVRPRSWRAKSSRAARGRSAVAAAKDSLARCMTARARVSSSEGVATRVIALTWVQDNRPAMKAAAVTGSSRSARPTRTRSWAAFRPIPGRNDNRVSLTRRDPARPGGDLVGHLLIGEIVEARRHGREGTGGHRQFRGPDQTGVRGIHNCGGPRSAEAQT